MFAQNILGVTLQITAISKKIDWVGAEKNGDLAAFSAEVTSRLEPLYSNVYGDAESIDSEIELVASILKETADQLLLYF